VSASEWGAANATLPFPPASVSNWGTANATLSAPPASSYWGVRNVFGVLIPNDGFGQNEYGESPFGQ